MAKFKVDGVNGLDLGLRELANIPPRTKSSMFEAMSAVAIQALEDGVKSAGLIDSRQLIGSMQSWKRRGSKGLMDYYVGPRGKRKKVRSIKGSRIMTSETAEYDNAYIGYVLEFGAPRKHLKAYQWMRNALEKWGDKIVEAGAAVFDKWIDSQGL